MNLVDGLGKSWMDANTESVLAFHVNDVNADGQIERLAEKLDRLTEVVGRLIKHVAKNDEQALDIVRPYYWSLDK